MSAGMYQNLPVSSATPFSYDDVFPFGYIYSTTGYATVVNNGPGIVYAGMMSKATPAVINPVYAHLTVYPGQMIQIPADTEADSVCLGFNTPATDDEPESTITVIVGQ